MYIQYPNNLPISQKKDIIDSLVKKALSQKYVGFDIKDVNKSWEGNLLKVSLNIKKGPIERVISGTIKLVEEEILIEFHLPEIVKNFVSDAKIEKAINEFLDSSFK